MCSLSLVDLTVYSSTAGQYTTVRLYKVYKGTDGKSPLSLTFLRRFYKRSRASRGERETMAPSADPVVSSPPHQTRRARCRLRRTAEPWLARGIGGSPVTVYFIQCRAIQRPTLKDYNTERERVYKVYRLSFFFCDNIFFSQR